MKTTITARPVLIPCEESTIHLSHGKLIESTLPTGKSTLYKSIPQQLILISDEKIEVGDKCYLDNSIESIPDYNGKYIIDVTQENVESANIVGKKVIATQSQLSPEYIQLFISEYNNGGINDVEIEMKDIRKEKLLSIDLERLSIIDNLGDSSCKNCLGHGCVDTGNEFGCIIDYCPDCYPPKPKLTNGFITIVGKEPITYTDNEVITFLQKYRCDLASGKTPMIGNTTKDWFNNNKKK